MIGFHIDMNMAHYRADYLTRWLAELAGRGYDTILWEVENNVPWETCPECASPDALSRETFRRLLGECRSLGLEAIPLFQTFGHAEYVLKHEAYSGLRELPARIDQYCPRNEDLLPFLHRWIDEYLDLFGDVRYFHIGADEAWALGTCPQCKQFAADHSLSQLYVDHVNAVAAPLIGMGIEPAIWADMVLHYSEALDRLSREIVLFDWMYDIYRGSGRVWVWGEGMRAKADLSSSVLSRFGPYLFPDCDEPGREPETFYTADFLAGQGFQVVTCPSASSYGDNVFTPRHWLHVANTVGSFAKGASPHLSGSVLTSWSVRLHPWEVQLAAVDVPGFLAEHPGSSAREYQGWYVQREFGLDDTSLWRSCGLLSRSCLFSDSGSLGYGKACLPAADEHVARALSGLREARTLGSSAAVCKARQAEYREALLGLRAFAESATRGTRYLDAWELAARNLISRADVSSFLIERADDVIGGRTLAGGGRKTAHRLLAELRALREETDRLYGSMVGPARRDQMIAHMYGPVEGALASLLGEGSPASVAAIRYEAITD